MDLESYSLVLLSACTFSFDGVLELLEGFETGQPFKVHKIGLTNTARPRTDRFIIVQPFQNVISSSVETDQICHRELRIRFAVLVLTRVVNLDFNSCRQLLPSDQNNTNL